MADEPSNGVVDLVVRRVRTLLGNPRKDRDTIIRHIEICNEEDAAKFQSFGLQFDTRVVTIPNVAANTTDLSEQQVVGGELFDLLVPEFLSWKLAGQAAILWKPLPLVTRVADTDMGSGVDGAAVVSAQSWMQSAEWRGGTIYISACSVPVDIRVRGQFMPNVVDNDGQDPLRAAINVLVFGTARSVAVTEGGPASVMAKDLGARMLNALGDFQSNQVKAKPPIRLGGRRTRRRRGGFQPPIG